MDIRESVSDLTPDQRRRELAAILAAGVMRLRRLRFGAPASPPGIPRESASKRLEVSDKTVLSVLTVLDPESFQHKEHVDVERRKRARRDGADDRR